MSIFTKTSHSELTCKHAVEFKQQDTIIISYHIIRKIYSAPITLKDGVAVTVKEWDERV